MDFLNVLEALEAYLRIRREAEHLSSAKPCLDWDCGLAADLEAQPSGSGSLELAEAKKELERAINRYIDGRVRDVLTECLRNQHSSDG